MPERECTRRYKLYMSWKMRENRGKNKETTFIDQWKYNKDQKWYVDRRRVNLSVHNLMKRKHNRLGKQFRNWGTISAGLFDNFRQCGL